MCMSAGRKCMPMPSCTGNDYEGSTSTVILIRPSPIHCNLKPSLSS